MLTKKNLGAIGERIAKNYLRLRGYQIIKTNFYTRYGEVDIIAKKNKTIHFVEVKTRSNKNFGYPEQAVDRNKSSKIALAAEIFLLAFNINTAWQIDVIAIEFKSKLNRRLTHIQNIIIE
ncbi:MAG: YraN family protein [Patescibacteria group bacterium]|nr:YraN family protein [Patescibacteria group bacterium]